jgi:hypothetical protein
MFHSAIQMLQTESRNVSLAGVAAIDLLTQVIKVDNVLLANQNHSLLQAASWEFLSALLLHTKTRLTAVRAVVSEALRALTVANLGKTEEKATAIPKEFQSLSSIIVEPLAQRNCLKNRSFGSVLPGSRLGDVKTLVNSSHGQRF